jgi:hypothetical protein
MRNLSYGWITFVNRIDYYKCDQQKVPYPIDLDIIGGTRNATIL